MADILKISTPLIDKNTVNQTRQVTNPEVPFQMTETTKVVKPSAQSELLQQNNGMISREESPNILANLLKDPSVTVSFLKNIYMLQEFVQLIPVNNNTMTEEIQQMFDALLVKPEDIVGELLRQESASTRFKGELFDFLRQLVTEHQRPELKYAVSNLLKSLNALMTRQSMLHSVANSLQFLADCMSSSKSLYAKLLQLSADLRKPEAADQFGSLKSRVLQLLSEVEGSILFTPKIAKILPLIVYNLSRFNDNPDYLQDCVGNLLTLMDTKQQKSEFVHMLGQYLDSFGGSGTSNSKVMDALAKLLGQQAAEELTLANSERIEKIIHSLLSSPCNFTPLLHFVIPVQDAQMKSFAEIWIDPNPDEKSPEKSSGERSVHILIVFDIEGIGQFEAELFTKNKNIRFNLLCPPAYVDHFSKMKEIVPKVAANAQYTVQEIYIGRLERSRSLMDVFKNLPHKRTGINVKI